LKLETKLKPEVILLGDSLFQGFGGAGRHVSAPGELAFKKHLEPLNCANYGVAGDKIENILWRIENGEISHRPKLIVLLAGVNNLQSNSPEEILAGMRNLVDILSKHGTVIVLKLLPTTNPDLQPKAVAANKLLATNLSAVEIKDLASDCFAADGLHLNEKGYESLAVALAALIR